MTNAAIKTKLLFALKSNGFCIHKLEVVHNTNGSYSIGALLTNSKPSSAEEDAIVIKEDYRIKQAEETPQGKTQK